MEHWFSAWNKLYQDLEQKWSMISEQEQNSQLQLLEKSTEAVLDVWGKMDEQLALLKEKMSDKLPREGYHSAGTTYYRLEMFEEAAKALSIERAHGQKDELRLLYLAYAYLFNKQKIKASEQFLFFAANE